MFFIAIRI